MFDEITGLITTFLGAKRTLREQFALAGSFLGILIFIFSFQIVKAYINSPRPVIEIVQPTLGSEVAESETLLQGKVTPPDSKVTVNGKHATQNGDGSFSQTVELTEGKNTIKIEAQYFGKKSGLLYRALRILSEAEIKERELANQKAIQEIKDSAEQVVQATTEASVLGAEDDTKKYDQSIIASHELITNKDEIVIGGSIINTTKKTLGWIKITANYLDDSDIVDTKEVYATQADQYLAPGAEMPFAVPVSDKQFSSYELHVVYDAM